MAIDGYFIIGYWWLLMVIILMDIGEYFIVDIGGY
jgi:hypothetical protein